MELYTMHILCSMRLGESYILMDKDRIIDTNVSDLAVCCENDNEQNECESPSLAFRMFHLPPRVMRWRRHKEVPQDMGMFSHALMPRDDDDDSNVTANFVTDKSDWQQMWSTHVANESADSDFQHELLGAHGVDVSVSQDEMFRKQTVRIYGTMGNSSRRTEGSTGSGTTTSGQRNNLQGGLNVKVRTHFPKTPSVLGHDLEVDDGKASKVCSVSEDCPKSLVLQNVHGGETPPLTDNANVCIDLPLTNFGFYSGEVMILM